jgi:hypothetical protein
MKKFPFLIFIVTLFSIGRAFSQTYEVPQNYSLKTKEDYAKYETDVIKTIDWLQQTAFNEQPEKRKAANTFLMAWATGSPSVSVEIGNGLMKLAAKNQELIVTFMGGYIRYALSNKDSFDKLKANTASVRAIIAKYKSDPSLIRDSHIDHLEKLDKEGKLENWIKTDFDKD